MLFIIQPWWISGYFSQDILCNYLNFLCLFPLKNVKWYISTVLNSHLGLAWPPGALTCAGRPRGPGREGWTGVPRALRSPTHVPGRRSGRVSLELWRLWWLMLNSPGPFVWKQLSSRFPTTLLSPKHAKEQRRAFLSSSFQTLPNSTL